MEGNESSPARGEVRLEDLPREEFGRLFGQVFGRIKKAAGLEANCPDEELYAALKDAASLKARVGSLESELAEAGRRSESGRTAAGRLYGLLLESLPGTLREGAPAADAADPADLARWAEIAARVSRSAPIAPPKQVDPVRSGSAVPASDAETWLKLLADSQSAVAFKRAHPEEWRRLVSRFGDKSLSEIRKLRAR